MKRNASVVGVAVLAGLIGRPIAAQTGAQSAADASAMVQFLPADLPATLKLNDLGAGWKRMAVHAGLPPAPSPTPLRPDARPNPDEFLRPFGIGASTYLTRGQVLTSGSQSFLVAYRARYDVQAFGNAFEARAPQFVRASPTLATAPAVLNALDAVVRAAPLDLVLLRLDLIGSVSDAQSFDLEAELSTLKRLLRADIERDQKREAQRTAADTALSRLTAIGRALQQYQRNNGGFLPPMQTLAVARANLAPYLIGVAADSLEAQSFTTPDGKPFAPNPILSRKKFAHIAASRMIAFYQAVPSSNGSRAVLRADGQSLLVTASEWPRLKRAARLP